jgi:hypothetical protein
MWFSWQLCWDCAVLFTYKHLVKDQCGNTAWQWDYLLYRQWGSFLSLIPCSSMSFLLSPNISVQSLDVPSYHQDLEQLETLWLQLPLFHISFNEACPPIHQTKVWDVLIWPRCQLETYSDDYKVLPMLSDAFWCFLTICTQCKWHMEPQKMYSDVDKIKLTSPQSLTLKSQQFPPTCDDFAQPYASHEPLTLLSILTHQSLEISVCPPCNPPFNNL